MAKGRGSTKGTRTHNTLTIDLDRLEDTIYMEVLVSTPAWVQLSSYVRSAFLVDCLHQIRSSPIPDHDRRHLVEGFLRLLSNEERETLNSVLSVSELLDLLVLSRQDLSA